MTTDKEYSDMGMCPRCLSENHDGTCSCCGYVYMDDVQWPDEDDYNYITHSESD